MISPRLDAATRRVLLCYVAFVLIGVSAGVGGVLLPAQIADYGIDRATVGITFFTFSAGFLLSSWSAGALVARLGYRAALVVGGGTYLLAALYTATRPSFGLLVGVQLLAGYGTGVLESVLQAYLAELPRATHLLNRLHAFFGVGALIGPILAAWMLLHWRWPMVWLVLGLASVPVLAGFVLLHEPARRRTPPPDLPVTAADPRLPEPDAEPPVSGGLLGAALRQPGVLLASALLAAYVGLEIGVGNWAYSYLVGARGQGHLLASNGVSGYWLGLTVGRFVISPVTGRWGWDVRRMALACLAGITGASVLIWLVPVPAVASAGLVLLGFFLGPIFPTTMAVVPRLTSPRLVPTAIGVLNGVSVVGGSALPWLAGALSQGIGLWTLFPYAAVLAVLQVGLWLGVTRRLSPEAPPAGAPVGDSGAAQSRR